MIRLSYQGANIMILNDLNNNDELFYFFRPRFKLFADFKVLTLY